jgi:hypothetical protein
MANTWAQIINPPQDGEIINHETEKRPLMALQQRTDFLFERLNDFSAQNGKLVIQNVRVANDVVAGDWVYFNSGTQKYEKAIAEGIFDESLKQYTASQRTFVVGLCIYKQNTGNLGSILMSGWIKNIKDFSIVNVSQMLEDSNQAFTPGRFYLSRKKPGKMTSIAGAPLIQLGFFTEKEAFVQPIQKDIFESHIHYKFELEAKPSASQNTNRLGWVDIGGKKYVDYFYSSEENDAPEFVMCIKGNGAHPAFDSSFRIDIKRSSAQKLTSQIYSGIDLDFENPESGTLLVSNSSELDIPNYGSWIDIPYTGISISFFRPDGIYTNTTLQSDFQYLDTQEDKFSIFYESDILGWTNTNPFDGRYTIGSTYRYLREFNKRLNAVWPPVPTESVSITNNGVGLVTNKDFKCFPQDLLWLPATFDENESRTNSPWPHDYIARRVSEDPDPNESLNKYIEIFFSKANVSTARPLVLSLQSFTPAIQVLDCLTKEESTVGNLALDLRLDLNTKTGPDSDKCFASIDRETQKFVTSGLVSKLIAGPGIQIDNALNGLPSTNGVLRISSKNIQSTGEVSIVSLKNAKESLHNGIIPCVVFLPPSSAKCQIIAKIKIPDQEGFDENNGIRLFVSSNIFGSRTIPVTESHFAIFKLSYYILPSNIGIPPRQSWANINLNLIDDSSTSLFDTKYWKLSFNNYQSYSVGKDREPRTIIPVGGNSNGYVSTGSINGIENQKIRPGDVVYVMIERISSFDSDGDTYNGDIGFLDISWKTEVFA